MSEQVNFKFPVVTVLYELDTVDEEYLEKVDATAEDLRLLVKGDLTPYKSEGENTQVRIRVFTKRC